MAYINVSKNEVSRNTKRNGRLSVLRHVTLHLAQGRPLRSFYTEFDGGIAHTFQPTCSESFPSDKIIYARGYGLYVVDSDDTEFLTRKSRRETLYDALVGVTEPVICAMVEDEIIPCNKRGGLIHDKIRFESCHFKVVNGEVVS